MMKVAVDEKDLKAVGTQPLPDGRRGLRIHDWEVESHKGTILKSSTFEEWEEKLDTTHLPEMVFGESGLVLKHDKTSTKIHINAFDALGGWKKEGLPFIEVLAVVQWKFRRYLLDFISRLYFNFIPRLFEEAQLVSLVLKDISTFTIDKTLVLALKRKALMLKHEGKLAEAMENLSWTVNLSL